jgi:adenylosuccinate synthase
MLINQIVESMRGSTKHGSCGIGFNETIERNENSMYNLSLESSPYRILLALYSIRDEYLPKRLESLGINMNDIPNRFLSIINSTNVVDNYMNDIFGVLKFTTQCDNDIVKNYDSIIFEGAQGLLLDQDQKDYFPHVTRSNTGMSNVHDFLMESGLNKEPINITYVTRPYLTRHGAGKLKNELPKKPYHKIIDLTNTYNVYQDSLRYALLDIKLLKESIEKDLHYAGGLNYKVKLAVTCLDQLDISVDYYIGNERQKRLSSHFSEIIMRYIGINQGYESYGMTRETIFEVDGL